MNDNTVKVILKRIVTIALAIISIYGFCFSMLTFSCVIEIPLYCILYLIVILTILVASIVYLIEQNGKISMYPHRYKVQVIERERDGDYIYIARDDDLRYNVIMSVYYKSQGIDRRVAIGAVVDPGTGSYTKLEIWFSSKMWG